jgi:hypothetical protein
MSLDVTLKIPGKDREDFNSFEIRHLATNFAITCEKGYKGSYDAWFKSISSTWRDIANRDNPEYEKPTEEVYGANITHNLGEMAKKAGIYEALWRPYRLKEGYNVPEEDHQAEYDFEENNLVKAYEIIAIIEKGLEDLKSRPEYFKQFNSPNGWGMYDNFVPFVEEYLKALKEYPESFIVCCR